MRSLTAAMVTGWTSGTIGAWSIRICSALA
jgi:hypothetical protein